MACALWLSACHAPETDMPGELESPKTEVAIPDAEIAHHGVSDKRRLTDFALLDHHGQPFNRARLEGQWSLLFFGFTRCPDICPPTLSQLIAVQGALVDVAPPLRVVFVSVDPAVDTPEVMARYVTSFAQPDEASALTGVTGDERQIKALTTQLGVYYAIEPNHDHDNHHNGSHDDSTMAGQTRVDHSGTVLLIDPEAYLHAVFSPPLGDTATLRDAIHAQIQAR